MYTSTDNLADDRRRLKGYAAMTVFCVIFSTVYEYFSHGVYSPFMMGLALFPLILGLLPTLVRRKAGLRPAGPMARTLRLWGVVTLTVASCLTGVFAIYGTISDYTIYFWILGALLMALAAAAYLKGAKK